ncbi:NAD(P)H-hydrate dehydratase [Lusitaniella coriacea LEGE 07157]|uniref:Bifunctional NAD(P)H-hydrate repair enzyme n=1 Tax=Lusitaniella coriacea LEGE 07157 TaxID=945747 RepID=A0A8J7DV75_9CYAN|nr:NAD(P)H-hydrate dehydratase [Lusitaniella coriacea]MBE9115612.1 NAD(P)H-hydrate dehydratase [Lusitaniella coriacea LEGE 07157]
MEWSNNRQETIERVVVSAEQMRQIEGRIFSAGMPVEALMEKVAGLLTARIVATYPLEKFSSVGVLVGPGHNGGDALVIARELHLQGYKVSIFCPFSKLKPLTGSHASYARSLSIPFYDRAHPLKNSQFLIDGLFGFGLTRELSGELAAEVEEINSWSQPIASIDLPSGIHTDTGAVLGTAVKATQTFCLGLWKRAFFQDAALSHCGRATLIDFGIPLADIRAILEPVPTIERVTNATMREHLPLPRPPVTHKYKQGHLLLICGSRRYCGGAILTGLGARASGVGMLSIAVPESLKLLLVSHLPEALIVGCPETKTGAIAEFPDVLDDLEQFSAIVCGPGLTLDARSRVREILNVNAPLILDADALNCLAQWGTTSTLAQRQGETILTPHLGEFKRLFPDFNYPLQDAIASAQNAAAQSGAIIVLKGARTAIAHPNGSVKIVPESTPALARGGSGDVLAGLIGGLVAQPTTDIAATVATAATWHARAGLLAAGERTELGVDAHTLGQFLTPALAEILAYPLL